MSVCGVKSPWAIAIGALALLLLFAAACEGTSTLAPTPTATPIPVLTPTLAPTPEFQYLTEEIPPCTPISGSSVDPCEPDAVVETAPLKGLASGGIFSKEAPRTIREHLDGSSLISIPHIVLRGTFIPGTVRCDADVPNRNPSYEEHGGYFEHSVLIQCYADIQVNGYVLGTGPPRVPVLVTYWHYWHGYYAGGLPEIGLNTEEEYVEALRALYVNELEEDPLLNEGPEARGDGIYGREMVLFIGPGHNHATEVWEIFRVWDVQRRADGTVIAVHPERNAWRAARPDDYQTHLSDLEMELPAFTQAVTTAHQARVTEYGGRIAPEDIQSRAEGVELPMLITDVNRLRQYYTEVGAYDDPDNPPSPPPPPCGLAVPNQTDNPGLMRDCITLLAAKDPLRGTGTLNWSTGTAIADWDGVTTGGTPSRVTKLLLSSKSLTGTIPAELGNLFELTHLNLSSNSLTGDIPRELGWLHNLQEIRLSGNSLTGCIPLPLNDVTTNDLSSLNLPYCRPPVFGDAAYSFSIIEDAAVGSTVGAVSASDPDEGDTVTYSITAGNEDGKFAVDGSTGRITVSEALDYETTPDYSLTVTASDTSGGTATVDVAISVIVDYDSGGLIEVSSWYGWRLPAATAPKTRQ